MKTLDDLTLFDREESPFLFQTGRAVVWENISILQQYERYGLSYDPALFVNLFCHSYTSNHIYYQHRIHQLPVTFDYIISGSCYFRSGKKAFLAEAGEMVILPQDGDNAILYLPSSGHCERYGMLIDGTLFHTLLKFYHLDGFLNIPFANPQVILSYFESLKTALKDGSTSEYIAALLFEFLCILGKYHSHNALPPLLVEIISYLDAHLSDKIHINAVAQRFHISVQGLNDLFRKHLQTTAYQYLISKRMTRAKELLGRMENFRINEIAFLCGYENPLHFSTEFRQYFGKSPRAFRKS